MVLQPNFRGSSGYGDEWFAHNGFRSWQVSVGDVCDGARWLLSQGIADGSRLAVFGWSYGGYAALLGEGGAQRRVGRGPGQRPHEAEGLLAHGTDRAEHDLDVVTHPGGCPSGVPDGLAFSADGALLYASDVFGGAVTAIDLDRNAVLAVMQVGQGTGAMLAFRP